MKHDHGIEFYLVSSVGNLDGTIDLDDESPRTFESVKEALDEAKEIVREYAMPTYVYRCTPIYRVESGKPRVTKI